MNDFQYLTAPFDLEVLLHHYSYSNYPSGREDVFKTKAAELEELGLIEANYAADSGRFITRKGKAHVTQILSLPLPRPVFINRQGIVIQEQEEE